MKAEKIGIELGRIWEEDRELYRFCFIKAQEKRPLEYDENRSPINILEVRKETLRVYNDVKKGRISFEGNGEKYERIWFLD
jgi:hypothetical protein